MRIQLLAIVVCLAVSGCGYHLRGPAKLPESIQQVWLQAGQDDFAQAVLIALEDAGVAVTEDAAQADASIVVQKNELSSRLLSVDPDSGRPREYELAYTVRFKLIDGDKKELLPTQEINLLRDFEFDADALIGKSRERTVLAAEMRRDAAQQLMRRIRLALE